MDQHSVIVQVMGDVDSLWALHGDMGNITWMPPTRRVEVEDQGSDRVRRIFGSSETPVVERWISCDPERRQIVYRIESNNPLPADPYVVTSYIEQIEPGRCAVHWQVDFESTPEDREKVVGGIEKIYPMIAGWLEDAVRAD
jgi:hypothetical protein